MFETHSISVFIFYSFRIINNIERNRLYYPIQNDENFESTTVLQVQNDFGHSYHINKSSFPGLLLQDTHPAVIENMSVEIAPYHVVVRLVIRMQLNSTSVAHIEVGACHEFTGASDRVICSAIFGDVRQCAYVVPAGVTDDADAPKFIYKYTGGQFAVKLIRKELRGDPSVGDEDPWKEIACTQFIQSQHV